MRSTWKLPQFYPWSGWCPVRQKACLADLDKVRQKELVNGLGGVGHENTASEGGFLEKIGQGSSMIQVKVSDEKNIDYGRVNLVEIGQSSHARVSRVYSTIEQDSTSFPAPNGVTISWSSSLLLLAFSRLFAIQLFISLSRFNTTQEQQC